tara:strand:- start:153 stop:254 length:102 start_codon:yes stop_codon:yes gene_type:complete
MKYPSECSKAIIFVIPIWPSGGSGKEDEKPLKI